jgi:Trk-type K+ transport system membrane component
MIHDIVLRWVVIGLFALTAVEYGVAVITKPRPWTSAVNHALHFVMAVAMVVMAWPWRTQLPTTEPAVFFLLAAVTFAAMAIFAVRTTTRRELYFYHGLMMLATAWMYAVMNSHLMPAGSSMQPDTSMPGMDMSATSMPSTHESPIWFSVVGWIGVVGFAVAAVFWTYRYVLDRRRKTAPRRSLGDLGQAMMAAGMAIFFLATLFPI